VEIEFDNEDKIRCLTQKELEERCFFIPETILGVKKKYGDIKSSSKEKVNLNEYITFFANTHKAFLKKAFDVNVENNQKSYWNYYGDPDIIVWMVRFEGQRDGWKNRFVDESKMVIKEELF